jgi:signal-transduction protein with cAMP-binding, CBS, and nucleotidyltransferase domain
VGQLLQPPATTIEPTAHLAAAAYLLKHSRAGALVVTTDSTHEPIALVTDADISRAVADGLDPGETRVSQVFRTRPVTVQTDASAPDATRLMLSRRLEHLVVVEGRRFVGVVDLADLCKAVIEPGPMPPFLDGPEAERSTRSDAPAAVS